MPKKIILSIFFLTVWLFTFWAGKLSAADAIPEPRVPCLENEFRNPEFNSQRPYQASPCGDSTKAVFCSNNYTIIEKVSTPWSPTRCDRSNFTCVPEKGSFIIGGNSGKNYLITLSNAQIPILGNTQETANSRDAKDKLDDAQKMNEYLSWYLTGTTQKAEYGTDSFDKIVNFSGPVKKLVPSVIQEFQRFATLHEAGVKEKYTTDPNEYAGDPKLLDLDPNNGNAEVRETSTHNQIVVCTTKNIFGINNPWIGTEKPIPCYDGNDKKANGKVYRMLEWWGGKYAGLIESLDVIPNWDGSQRWNYTTPPFPWQFTEDIYYQKAYNEWRGKECLIVPIFKKLLCVDIKIPGVAELHTNSMADFYQYIPLGNPTDKNAKHIVGGVQAHGEGGTQAKVVSYDPLAPGDEPVLFYPHTQSTLEISKLLNETQGPKGIKGQGEGVEPSSCEFVDVRSNSGDDIIFENSNPKTQLSVRHVKTEVSLIGCANNGELEQWFKDCGPTPGLVAHPKCSSYPSCDGEVAIVIPTTPKIPNLGLIWQQTVADTNSAFRRIFPKIEEGAPVSCIADIPGASNVNYTAASDTNLTKVTTAGPNVYTGQGSIQGQLFFPHLGSIYEYFLKGIQTALRPQGYGEPITNGNLCATTQQCGEWESKLKDSGGECGVCNIPIGNLAKKILATAGAVYNVPAANIWAAMKHEGADWDEFRNQFTDENVRKWSTPTACGGEPMPKCDPNDKTSSKSYPPFGFLPYWFYRGEGDGALWTAVQQFDPTRNSINKVSHCNFLDAAFAAAKSLATWSGFPRTPATCYGYNLAGSNRPASCGSGWTDEKVVQSQVGYWIGVTPWCPDGNGGPSPLVNNIPIPDYASRVLSDFHSARCQ